jgi:hypothetical protein
MSGNTLHGFLDDCDFRALPQEQIAWEPEWDAPPEPFYQSYTDLPVLPNIPEVAPPHTLEGKYARMLLDKEEATLWDFKEAELAAINLVGYDEHEAEVNRVLGTTFECLKRKDNTDARSTKQLITELEDKSNYTVEEVVRVMNKAQYNMHRAVAASYNLSGGTTTYHGTSKDIAPLITNTGFKGSACERSMYGKGVYSSPNVWVALGYAQPFEQTRQIFFVVDYHKGPHAPGHQGQVNFGVDGYGQEVLTLTSPDGSILCASRENQLLATYRITVRYLTDRPFTQRIKDVVHSVHCGIGTLIKSWGKPTPPVAPAASTTQGGAPAPAPVYSRWGKSSAEVDATHIKYKVGDAVVVTGALKAYQDSVGQTGVIKRIVQGHHYYFCILLDCPKQRPSVKDANSLSGNKERYRFLKPDEQELLCLKVGHIEKRKPQDAPAGGAASASASLGKRKAEAEADKDDV